MKITIDNGTVTDDGDQFGTFTGTDAECEAEADVRRTAYLGTYQDVEVENLTPGGSLSVGM